MSASTFSSGLSGESFWFRRPALTAVGIIAVTTLIRFWFVASGQLDLVQDEAQYWDWTRRMQLSYYSKGPLIAWVIKLWTTVFGNTELGVRFGSLLHACLAQCLLYWGVANVMKRPRVALWTLIIANTTVLFNVSGILMTTDNPLLLCWALALFSLYWASEEADAFWPYCFLGISMMLGVLAKYMMLGMAGIAFLYICGLYRHHMLPEGFVRRVAIAIFLGTALGFLPIILWNMQNNWVGFLHVGTLAGVTSHKSIPLIRFDRFPEYFGSQIGLITPWWFVFMLAGAWRAGKLALQNRSAAAVREDARTTRQSILLAAAFWMLWGFFIIWSFHKRIYPNWSAMSYVSGMILAAFAVDRGSLAVYRSATAKHPLGPRLRKLWVTLGIIVFIGIHSLGVIPFTGKFNPATRLMGWHDLGHKLHEIQQSLPNPEKVFFFADAYDITASLAFYAPGKPVTYCADFGRRMSQYDIWPGPQDKKGWDAVFVRKDQPAIPEPLQEMFEEASYIEYQTMHRGKLGRKFYIATLRNFTGKWPRQSFGVY